MGHFHVEASERLSSRQGAILNGYTAAMGSLISYGDMEHLYETTGATLLRHPWGRSYDQTIGPDPGGPGVAFPASGMGMILSCPKTTERLKDTPLQAWADALESRDSAAVASTYGKNALLLATVKARPKVGRAAIRRYFDELVKKPGLRVDFQSICRVSPGVLAGVYVFRWDGGSIPARFTFVIGRDGIVHHHSSASP